MKLLFTATLSALSLLLSNFLQADGQSLANYIGTGSNPRIVLELSPNNGPKWGSYTIDYQGIGYVPWSSDPSINWSPWNGKDQDGNYYGTITLKSDGQTVTMDSYHPGTDQWFEGVNLSYNSGAKAYQLTVSSIHGGASSGPFPDAPPAAPAVYPGTSQPVIFSVQGDTIVNDKGAPILLKGMVRPSLEWNNQGQYLSVQDIQNIKNWGSNVIRLDLNQNFWFSSGPATQMGSYKQIINAIVYYAIQDDMAVILDLHWVTDGGQSPMANKDSIRFWQEVASDYKAFGTVLFELFNEPEGIDQNTWLNGNNQYAGYQQLYDAVRGTGAENICIVNGLNWGYDLSFVNESFKVTGNNIVYGSHPYNDKGSEGYTGQGGSFANSYKGVLGIYPLIFTEFGVNTSQYFPTGYEAVYDRILTYADQNLVNYTGFAWWVDSDPKKVDIFPDLIEDWSGTPFNGGVQVHEDLQNHPGTKLY